MDINELNKRVTIEKDNGTIDDGYGNTIHDWQPVTTVWGGVKPSKAKRAKNGEESITHNVTIRYMEGLKEEKHRVKFNGRILEIQYIINIEERNETLVLECLED